MNEEQPEERPAPETQPPAAGSVPTPHPPEVGGVPTPHPPAAGSVSAPRPPEVGGVSAPRPDGVGGVPEPWPVASVGAGKRPPWWLVAVLVVVGVGVGIGAGALIWAGQVKNVYPPGYHALSPEQYDKCVRSVVVYFSGPDPDPVMRDAATRLRDDQRFESVREETQQQAYKRFKKMFADQPDLVDTARPDTLPASVQLMVRKGSTAKDVKSALQREFQDAEVSIQDYCPPPE